MIILVLEWFLAGKHECEVRFLKKCYLKAPDEKLERPSVDGLSGLGVKKLNCMRFD